MAKQMMTVWYFLPEACSDTKEHDGPHVWQLGVVDKLDPTKARLCTGVKKRKKDAQV